MRIRTTVLVVVLLVTSTGTLFAQAVELDFRLGYSTPAGALAELENGGVAAGAALGFAISPSVVLAVRIDAELLGGADRITFDSELEKEWPDLTAIQFTGEVAYRTGATRDWMLEIGLGAGASTFSFKDAGSASYPALSGRVSGGVSVSDHAALFAVGQAHVVFSDSEDFEDLARFEDAWLLTLMAGFRLFL